MRERLPVFMLKTSWWEGSWLVCPLMALTILTACLGNFETKPTLTEPCRLNWQQQAGLGAAALPDSPASHGLQVLVFNIHDRLLPDTCFSSEGCSPKAVVVTGGLFEPYAIYV